MAVITASLNKQGNRDITVTWTPLENGDTGEVLNNIANRYATVQVGGTFGAGGTIILQGSLDGSTWVTLQDPANADISFTAAGMVTVRDMVKYIRPSVTAGDGTTALTCILLAR